MRSSGNISNIDLSIIPEINYTALNATWYDPKVEMLIITPDIPSFVVAATPLMNWKNQKGIKTVIRNASGYSGVGADQVRNLIIDYYENENLKWVLLAGDAQIDLIPIKYVPNPGSPDGNEPTDFYYADLNSNWSDPTSVDWTAEVYVGRLPANNAAQLEDMVDKIIKYETDPYIGNWMNRMLLSSGISDKPDSTDPDGEDEARLTSYIIQNYIQGEMSFTHLCDYNGRYDPSKYIPPQPFIDLTSSNTNATFTLGYSTAIYAGHGSSTTFQSRGDDVTTFYTESEAALANNLNMPTLIYGDACEIAPYDLVGVGSDVNFGETLILNPNGGAIGFVGSLRFSWYTLNDYNLLLYNRGNAKYFWMEFFKNNKYQQGRALYDSKETYAYSENVQYIINNIDSIDIRSYANRRNLQTYNLLGDPELDIYTDQPQVVSDPFPDHIYEGQLVSVKLVPYGNVHITTEDGMYHTAHADENGTAKFRLPLGAGIIYNVTITGHNYIPTNFSFITLPDGDDPISKIDCTPPIPTTLKNINFNAITNDAKSGIESIYMFMSINNFDDYITYQLKNGFLENETEINVILNKLVPGTYQYYFYVVSRDYANNTVYLARSFILTVPIPLSNYVFLVSFILIIGIAGISIFIGYKEINRYSRNYKRLKE